MKIHKISIENFKNIKETRIVHIDDFNVIVGQNDIGKSTILKALDCFLNCTSPLKDDLNRQILDTANISIIIEFLPENQQIIIDQNIETTFEEEELVNENNSLVIKKVWDTSKSKITADTYIYRKVYAENDFLPMTENQLLTKCHQLGFETHKANGDEFNNKEKRLKIREFNETNEISSSFEFEKLPTNGTNRFKIIHERIKKILPRFEYFKADTSLSETDIAIQKFFRTIAIQTINEEIDITDIEETITQKLSLILNNITSKINQVVTEAEEVSTNVTFDWAKLVSTKFKSRKNNVDIPLSSRGDGFRRITMMAYFEYLAEQQVSEQQNIIFGFEEPETFLHPSGQENLFTKLYALTENRYQVVITTHSSIIVANTKKENLVHIHKNDGEFTVEQNIENITFIANDLGINLDNQFITLFDQARVLLLVEGIDDANAFNHLSDKYKENQLIDNTLSELDITIIPIGGCDSIKHWISLDILRSLNKPFIIFQDSDKQSELEISPNKEKLEQMGFIDNEDFFISKKRNIENYISAIALNRLVPNANLNYGDFENVKRICGQHELASRLGGKGVTNKYFKHLSFEDLRTTFFDGNEDEFLNMYNKLKEKLDEVNN